MAARRPNRLTPDVLSLESRVFLTVSGGRSVTPNVLARAQALAAQVAPSTPVPVEAVPPFVPGPGTPLPNEIARARFTAVFDGPFRVGPPRFTGQSAILNYRGLGTSTEFLHGDFQMAVVMPSTPGSKITGAAYLQDKNVSGSNQIGLNINFDLTTLDRKGRPTHGIWATDDSIYSGTSYRNVGSGTVRLRYNPSGTATVKFIGSIYTNGITNPLRNSDL